MAEKPKSFEEFYFDSKDDIFDIDVVINYSDTHEGKLGNFDGHMFCPECAKAELSFVHKTSKRRAHLRRIKNTKHSDSCSYIYEYASKKTVKKYVDSLNYYEIQDKLNSIMNMLNKNPKKNARNSISNNNSLNNSLNPMLIPNINSSENSYKAIRRKRLNTWIDKTDGEDFYVFYGKVKLKVLEKEKKGEIPEENKKYNLLQIYTKNKNNEWKLRTNLYRGNIKDEIDEKSIYSIAMIGYLDFSFYPFNIKLANRNAIKYQKLQIT